MDFGLFYYCQGRGVPHDQAYAEMLDQIVLAEALGFGECWFAEHHFTDYSVLPSPNLMIAAALGRTRRMRFGNYVNVLPFHHPLRLAAEAAMLDNLARGRFDFGIGKGVRPGEFAKLGLDFEDATHPPLHMVASRPATAARVGARGWPVAMHFTPTATVARCVEEYRAAVAAKVDGLEAVGVDTLLLVSSFGDLSHGQVCRSLTLFAQAAIRPRQTSGPAVTGPRILRGE